MSEFAGIGSNLNVFITVGVVEEISGRFAYNKKCQRRGPKKYSSLVSTLTHCAMAHGKEASTSGNAKKCLAVIRLGSKCQTVDSKFLLGGEFRTGATTESSNLKLGKAK